MFRSDPFAEFDRLLRPVGRPSVPLDAVRRDGVVEVRVDLPGFDREHIDVQVDQRHLDIRADRPSTATDDETVLIRERRFGTVHRRLTLADELDADALSAEYLDGVLTISIPVRESATPRRIEIGAGAAA